MTKLCAEIRDSVSGEKVPARVQILSPTGELVNSAESIHKIGPGEPFFYSDGYFEVEVFCILLTCSFIFLWPSNPIG